MKKLIATSSHNCHLDYFSTDEALGVSFISCKMPRNRFEQQYNNLSDPASTSESDKLHKVRPFLRVLEEHFPKLLYPSIHVNEAMIKFDGRLLWKYMPKNPVGHQVVVLACGWGVETTFGFSTCAMPLCKLGPCFQDFRGVRKVSA